MNDEKFLLGLPINFKDKFKIYPPKIKEIVDNDEFTIYKALLTLSQEEIEDLFLNDKNGNRLDLNEKVPNPFEFLLINYFYDKNCKDKIIRAFKFFIHEDITILVNSKKILIGNIEEEIKNNKQVKDFTFLEEEDYFDFQNMIRAAMGDSIIEPSDPNESMKIKRMKAKARYRDKMKAKHNKGISLETTLTSICCMNLGLNPLNIGEMSYTAMRKIIERYQEKEKYETDIDCLLTGGDSKKIKPNYWIRNLED